MFSIYKQIPTFHWNNKGDYAADYVKHYSECYFNEIYRASPLVLSLVPSCNSHDQQACFSFLVKASQIVLILIYFPLILLHPSQICHSGSSALTLRTKQTHPDL